MARTTERASRHHSRPRHHPSASDDTVLAPIDRLRALNGDMVRVGDMVSVCVRRGDGTGEVRALVRRIYTATTPRDARAAWAHVHYLVADDACGAGVLQHRACRNVRARAIMRRVPGEAVLVGQPDGVWRDPLPSGPHTLRARGDPFTPTVCDACLSAKQDADARPRATPDRLRSRGRTFHPGDLVFVEPEDALTGQAWTPALLVSAVPCVVRLCGRVADLAVEASESELYLTDEQCEVAPESVMASALLEEEGGYTLRWRLQWGAPALTRLDAADRPPRCMACATAAKDRAFADPRLPSADIYAGGGGGVTGVNAHFAVRLAVDADSVAVQTLRANFLHVRAVQATVADFLSGMAGSAPPAPGTLALLVAGPPCQGHTRINHTRRADDGRNGEIGVALDAVDALRPDVFVLENVEGFNDASTGGINFAHEAVKRLVKDLGYQVRVGLLDSRESGSPQQRRRIFVLAARRGVRLPTFPPPTHANPAVKSLTFTLANTRPVPFGQSRGHIAGTAERPAVTARDALGDFPRWEYACVALLKDNVSDGSNAEFTAGGVGVPDGTPMRAARTAYHRRARGVNDVTRGHVTDAPSAATLQRILSAPRVGTELPGFDGKYRRADPAAGVPTLLASPWPGQKGTGVVHWSQHRVFTVAERRRITGLPDTYVLAGSVREQNQMLGNMIDVHVAEALAAHIKEEVYGSAWRAWGKPDTETFWRRWRRRHPL